MSRTITVLMLCAGIVTTNAKVVGVAAEKKKVVKPVKEVVEMQSAPAEKAVEKSKWVVHESVDEITDEKILIASLCNCGFSISRKIIIRIKGGELDIFINWDTYLGHHDDINIILRFDDGEPVTETWSLGTSGETCFSKYPAALLESLLKHKKLAVRVYDYGGRQFTEVFDISGLEDALKPYHKKYFNEPGAE